MLRKSTRFPILIAGAYLIVLLGVAGWVPTTAQGAGRDMTTSDANDPAEIALSQAGSLIQDWAEGNPKESSGFLSVEVVGDRSGLIVHWAGEPPSSFNSTLALARKLTDVSVSSTQGAVATQETVQAVLKAIHALGIDYKTIGPSMNSDAVLVGVSPDLVSKYTELYADELAKAANQVPVRFIPDSGTYEFAATRRSDTSPFWGGSEVDSITDGQHCTTLAVMEKNSGASHDEGLVTARHCGHNQPYHTYEDNRDVGNALAGDAQADAVFIANETYGSKVYDGAWDSGDSAAVDGGSSANQGEDVCTNGGLEGRHCAGPIQVETVGQTVNMNGVEVGPGFWFSNRDFSGGQAHPAIGGGDSGSAVFVWADAAHDSINIRGMFVIRDTGVTIPCAGSPDLPGRPCSYRGFAVNISKIRGALDVTLKH